ncbi:MAG TPA: methylmalonyl-CoA mutase family protein, partial [Cyclobacteriaceae bacterium]|nr:methylmalonyl-CoA mutase family protein [Cyclobacteriaceae bacterium]
MEKNKNLFEEFSAGNKSDWQARAAKENKIADPLKALSFRHVEGIAQAPYYDQDDVKNTIPGFTSSGDAVYGARAWYNMPYIAAKEFREVNTAALTALQQGADGVLIDCAGTQQIDTAWLNDIELPYCRLAFLAENEAAFQPLMAMPAINAICFYKGPQAKISLPKEKLEGLKMAGIVLNAENRLHELKSALALSKQYLAQLMAQGLSADEAALEIAFLFTLSTDFFKDIAFLRSLRRLFYTQAKELGCKNFKAHDLWIQALNPNNKIEALEPHSNMLLGTTASIAAAIGHADGISLQAEKPIGMEARIACNVSNILREESRLHKVADPAAGAY